MFQARSTRYSEFPSMKKGEIVDGSTKTKVPSMKRAENMDGSRGEAALKVNDQKCNALKNLIENRSQTIAPVTQLREKKRTHIRSIGSWECIPVLICAYCRHDAQHNQKRAYSLFAWNYLEMLFMAMDDSDACKTLASGSMAQTEQKKRSSISRRPSDQTSGSHLSVLPYYLLTNFTEVLTSSEAAATYAVNVPSSSVHPPRAGS